MNWRAWIAGGVFVALLIAAVLIARPQQVGTPEVQPPAPQPATPVTIAPTPPLTRADLIDMAGRAADAYARGVAAPSENGELAGRRFTLRLPFGCTGPATADSEAPMRWSYDEETETLRIWVTPKVWTDAAPVRAAAAGIDYEAAEGFWIERPWLRSGDCPVSAQSAEGPAAASVAETTENAVATENATATTVVTAPADEQAEETVGAPPARQTLALVELFEPDSRRAARRNGRPYTVVSKLAPGEIDLSKGLRLVLSGRLAPLRGGMPTACSGTLIDERPLCIIRAEIDGVAITDSSGNRVLGKW